MSVVVPCTGGWGAPSGCIKVFGALNDDQMCRGVDAPGQGAGSNKNLHTLGKVLKCCSIPASLTKQLDQLIMSTNLN